MNDAIQHITMIDLARLRGHPLNSNAMPTERFEKLKAHIDRTGRYPPLIVRPSTDDPGVWQVLDGHHRWRALEELGQAQAACTVWEVDDDETLVLLATLNRLEGADDPRKRSALLREIGDRLATSRSKLAKLLPDKRPDLEKMLSLAAPPPRPRPAPPPADLPRAVHFFLIESDRKRLEASLSRIGGSREQALMQLVTQPEG